jgi:hypothetical protein
MMNEWWIWHVYQSYIYANKIYKSNLICHIMESWKYYHVVENNVESFFVGKQLTKPTRKPNRKENIFVQLYRVEL